MAASARPGSRRRQPVRPRLFFFLEAVAADARQGDPRRPPGCRWSRWQRPAVQMAHARATIGPDIAPISAACAGYPLKSGGETGIRTLGGVTPTTVFETAPFDRSGISPLSGLIGVLPPGRKGVRSRSRSPLLAKRLGHQSADLRADGEQTPRRLQARAGRGRAPARGTRDRAAAPPGRRPAPAPGRPPCRPPSRGRPGGVAGRVRDPRPGAGRPGVGRRRSASARPSSSASARP